MGLPLTFLECATLNDSELSLLPISYFPPILQELVSEDTSINIGEVASVLQKLETGDVFSVTDILSLPDSKLLQEVLQDVPLDDVMSEFLTSSDLSMQEVFELKSLLTDNQALEDLVNGDLDNEEIHQFLVMEDAILDKALVRCIENSDNQFLTTFRDGEMFVESLKSLVGVIDDVESFDSVISTFDEGLVTQDGDVLSYLWKWNGSSKLDKEHQDRLEKFILEQKGITTDVDVMKQSGFYHGIPISISEEIGQSYFTTSIVDRLSDHFYKLEETNTTGNEESIKMLRKIVKGNEAKFQKLFDYFTFSDVFDLTVLSTGYENDLTTRGDYNEVNNFSDNSIESLMLMVTNTDFSNEEELNKLRQNINLRLGALKLAQMGELETKVGFEMLFGVPYADIIDKNQSKSSIRFALGHSPKILSEWIDFYKENNELNGTSNKIDLDLIARVDSSMIESVYNSSGAYSKFVEESLKSQDFDNVFEEMQYRKILNGLAISFDYFNSEDKKSVEDKINELVSNVMSNKGTANEEVMSKVWYEKEQKKQNINVLSLLFESITSKNNPEYLKDLQTNYSLICEKDIYRYGSVVGKESIDWFSKISKSRLGLTVDSVEEMWRLNTLKYDNMAINSAGAAAVMLQNGIDHNLFQQLQDYYLTAMERNDSSIPYASGVSGEYSYELLRQWDSYLMYFDSENNFANCPLELKKSLMTSEDMRLLVVKDSVGDIVENIVVRRNQDELKFCSIPNGGLANDEIAQVLRDVSTNVDVIAKENGDSISKYTFASSFYEFGLLSSSDKNSDELISDNKKYKDPPKRYRNLELCSDLPEKYRICRMHSRAFSQDGIHHIDVDSMIGMLRYQVYDSAIDFSVGRDWYMLTAEMDKETTVLYYMARFNENSNNLVGQSELKSRISEFINASDKNIAMTAFSSSYYGIARMAMDGMLMIESDNFVEQDSRSIIPSENPLNQYIVDGVINEEFGKGRHNNDKNYDDQKDGASEEYNRVLFRRIPDNPTDAEKERIEKQKSIYAQVVEQYDKKRDEARKKDRRCDIPLSPEETAKAGTLNISPGGIGYTRYKLSKSTLGSMGMVESYDINRTPRRIV